MKVYAERWEGFFLRDLIRSGALLREEYIALPLRSVVLCGVSEHVASKFFGRSTKTYAFTGKISAFSSGTASGVSSCF